MIFMVVPPRLVGFHSTNEVDTSEYLGSNNKKQMSSGLRWNTLKLSEESAAKKALWVIRVPLQRFRAGPMVVT